MKRILYFLLMVISAVILFAAGFILYLQLTSYHPIPKEIIYHHPSGNVFSKNEISILTWNIGYAGLGKEMDFFYEGGTMTRPGKAAFERYLHGITSQLQKFDTADFIFIQEIDRHSRRSYYTDELSAIEEKLKDRHTCFARNYDTRFVPVPLNNPMGRVLSGIAVFSKEIPAEASRIDFNTRFSWPKQLVMLQRGFILMRYPLETGKELVLINTHNSVFDEGGFLRKKELKMLSDTMNAERAKGNYVIAGGDWNMNPRSDNNDWLNNISGDKMREVFPRADSSLLQGWKFVFDPSQPTNRDVNSAYMKGKTGTTIIDFFVVSPEIEVEMVKTIPLGFEFSDHNPVLLKVKY